MIVHIAEVSDVSDQLSGLLHESRNLPLTLKALEYFWLNHGEQKVFPI